MAGVNDKARIGVSGAENEFSASEQRRRGMRPESRRVLMLGVTSALLLFMGWVMPTYIFEHSLVETTFAVILDNIATNFDGLFHVFVGDGAVFEGRFMAVLVCFVSGAALGLCGSAYQGAFNNPLAAPKTLGVMAGGAAGALIYVVFLQDMGPQAPFGESYTQAQMDGWLSTLNPGEWLWANYGKCLCSMAGCFIVVGIVVSLTSVLGRGRLSNVVVIIFGQVFAATVTALIAYARYYYTADADAGIDIVDQLREIENYTMVITYGYRDLLIVVVPLVVCMAVVLLMRRRLTLLSFGEDEAAAMGVNVGRSRYAMIAVCTVMTAIAISFCGHVSFLGFISAHLARRIVGPDFRFLLPASMFVGGGFLTLVQYVCQSGLPFTSPYAAGTACSIMGAILFMGIVLSQRGRGGSGDWR